MRGVVAEAGAGGSVCVAFHAVNYANIRYKSECFQGTSPRSPLSTMLIVHQAYAIVCILEPLTDPGYINHTGP